MRQVQPQGAKTKLLLRGAPLPVDEPTPPCLAGEHAVPDDDFASGDGTDGKASERRPLVGAVIHVSMEDVFA